MKTTPFFSKEVKLGRVFKGLGVSFACLIMLGFISYFGADSANTIYQRYTHSTDYSSKEVLGVETKPELIGEYADLGSKDEYVWDWNQDREGYYLLDKYIDSPQYYLTKHKTQVKDSWILKGGYEFKVSCTDYSNKEIVPADYGTCTLTYNGKVVRNDVRYYAGCENSLIQKNCFSQPVFTLYSNMYGSSKGNEYLVTYTYATGSKDDIRLYRLNAGKFTLLPFVLDGKEFESFFISSGSSDLYGRYSTYENEQDFNDPIELVTHFHEPSMGANDNVENIFRIWELKDNKLQQKNRVVDLYREDEKRYWN